jgi:catechol 2,3-dioxygenase-like lactoylglutathione lyase family enzyme
MLDHAGFPVSDYKRSKAFYEKALAPLGYVLVMEVPQTENDTPAAGFGIDRKPDFWIGGEGGLNRPVHIAIAAKDRAAVDAFHRAAIAAGGKDNGAPGLPTLPPELLCGLRIRSRRSQHRSGLSFARLKAHGLRLALPITSAFASSAQACAAAAR